MNYLNIASIINNTSAEGPGIRMAIWVQGCLKRCSGCCNPQFLSIESQTIFDTSTLSSLILENKQKYNIEGITLIGGEPFLQAEGLSEIAIFAKSIGLSVMVFSGYDIDELTDSTFLGASALLKHTDLLIDGEYDYHQQETVRNWVGSTNQNFHYLSDFYSPEVEVIKLMITNEWRISTEGVLLGNGLPFIMK